MLLTAPLLYGANPINLAPLKLMFSTLVATQHDKGDLLMYSVCDRIATETEVSSSNIAKTKI